jgi:hypothetical protein
VSHLTDNELLMNLDGIDWNTVAGHLGIRSATDCRIQWTVNQHPLINKNPFSKDEIKRLRRIATRYNHRNWDKIAEELGVSLKRQLFMHC